MKSRYLVWALLCAPCVALILRYAYGSLYYGEFIHLTGDAAVWLLMLTMAITPLRLILPGSTWVRWLVLNRRYFGVATFAYALTHSVAWLVRMGNVKRIIAEGLELDMLTGWVALVIFLLLALTSNNSSVHRLRARWKSLHRCVYPAAILTFLHWILTAFNPTTAYVHAAGLALFVAYGLLRRRK